MQHLDFCFRVASIRNVVNSLELSSLLCDNKSPLRSHNLNVAIGWRYRKSLTVLLCVRALKLSLSATWEKTRFLQEQYVITKLMERNLWGLLVRAVCKICQQRLIASSCLSVPPSARNNSARTGRIFTKLDIWVFYLISVEKIQVSFRCYKNNGYFIWTLTYSLVQSPSWEANSCFYETVWKNMFEPNRPRMTT